MTLNLKIRLKGPVTFYKNFGRGNCHSVTFDKGWEFSGVTKLEGRSGVTYLVPYFGPLMGTEAEEIS